MNNWKKLSIVLLWLGIWQITATFIHNPIMLVGPIEALQTLWGLLPSGDFWISIYQSFLRISIGFLTASMIGLLLGSLAYHIPFVKELLEPPMLFFKSVPVASFVILALICAGSRNRKHCRSAGCRRHGAVVRCLCRACYHEEAPERFRRIKR